MSKAHIGSQLPLNKYSIPIDYANTVQLNHFDVGAEDINGIRPLGAYVDESCVAYYDFNNVEGSILFDKSKYNNYCTINGCSIANGRNGKALSFDGSDDYVRMSRDISLGNTNWTVLAWVKTSTSGRNTILSNWNSGSVYNDISIYNSKICYRHYNNAWIDEYGTSIVADGNWHFLAWVNHSNQTMDLYVDGVREATVSSTLYPTGTGPVNNIGRNWGNTMNGSIDKVVIYNRSLSPEEVYECYQDGIYSFSNGKYGKAVCIEYKTTNLCNVNKTYGVNGWYLTTSNYMGTCTVLEDNPPFATSARFNFAPRSDPDSGGWQVAMYRGLPYEFDVTKQYTISLYIRMITPQYGLNISIRNTNGLNPVWNGTAYTSNDSNWHRFTATFTPLEAGTNRCIYVVSNENASFELADPQIEQNSFATSFTTGARETGKLIYSNLLKNSNEGTINFWAKYPKYSTSVMTGFTNAWVTYQSSQFIGINSTYQLQGFNNVDAALYEDSWHMYTIVKTGDTVDTYIDAEHKQTYTDPNFMKGDYLSLGANIDGSNISNIMIDELRIDAVARTEDEITAWYVSGAPFFPRGISRIAK